LRGHCIEAAGIAVSRWPCGLLDQGQEPGGASGNARGRGGVELGMAAIPEPQEDGPERWRWLAEANRETGEANRKYYWLHAFGPPKSIGTSLRSRRRNFGPTSRHGSWSAWLNSPEPTFPPGTAESRHRCRPIRDAGWSRPCCRKRCSAHSAAAHRSKHQGPNGSRQPRTPMAHGAGTFRTTPIPTAFPAAGRRA
jgi:hypothetical protein